ncbi:hypothetical protein ACUVF2_004772, partial [Escherichia coli]
LADWKAKTKNRDCQDHQIDHLFSGKHELNPTKCHFTEKILKIKSRALDAKFLPLYGRKDYTVLYLYWRRLYMLDIFLAIL